MRMTTLRIIPVLLALFLAHAMGGEPRIAILGDQFRSFKGTHALHAARFCQASHT